VSADATLIDYYSQRAREYERVYEKPERQEELRELKSLLPAALRGRNAIEIACGTGYWTEVAATSAASIAAFDINEAVLDIARRKPIDRQKVTFAGGDAYRPSVTTGRFDAAFAMFWWSHIPRAKQAEFLQALHSVLAPGAKVILVDNTFVPGESTPVARTDSEGNTYQTRRLEDGRAFEVLKNYPSEDDFRSLLRGHAGPIEFRSLKYYWWLTYQFEGDSSATRSSISIA
jgi:demethylmenaquinone methyltransferase/2-methoxy-6-polyprenyl-1,4-benzoquinol methylase